jgi:hypothetical protein
VNVKYIRMGKLDGKDASTWNDTHDDFMTRLLHVQDLWSYSVCGTVSILLVEDSESCDLDRYCTKSRWKYGELNR